MTSEELTTSGTVLRQVPRHGRQQHRPDADRAASRSIVPDVTRLLPTTWAMPCVPLAGMQMRRCSRCRRSAPAVWVEFEQGDPRLPDLDRLLLGAAAEVPALALGGTPAVHAASCCRRTLQNSVRDQRHARADRRDHAQDDDRRDDLVNDVGIIIRTARARDHDGRADRHDQPRRAGGDLSDGRRSMPGFLFHVGATVICAHGGQAQPTAPNPRVLVSGQPSVRWPRPRWSPAARSCPSAPRPCVTAQWLIGTTRVTSNGQPLACRAARRSARRPARRCCRSATQTRVTAE